LLEPNWRRYPDLSGSSRKANLTLTWSKKSVARAQGVFLWVFLVVRSLRDGLTNEDGVSLLRKRLDEIPSDLKEFFKKIIRSVDKVYQPQMAITVLVALRARGPLRLLTHWFVDEDDADWTDQPHPHMEAQALFEERMSRRLYGRYKGLLEVSRTAPCKRVDFIHRTLRDYLEDNARELFPQQGLNPYVKACRAFLKNVKFFASVEGSGYAFRNGENFVVFARYAEIDCQAMDYSLVDEMWGCSQMEKLGRAASGPEGDGTCFIRTLVRFGYTSGLQYLLSKHPELVRRHGSIMLGAALNGQDSPFTMARSLFGISSAVKTLSWLLSHGVSPNLDFPGGTEPRSSIFLDFLELMTSKEGVETTALGTRLDPSAVYDQWEQSLLVLLRHGADYKQVFDDPRTQRCQTCRRGWQVLQLFVRGIVQGFVERVCHSHPFSTCISLFCLPGLRFRPKLSYIPRHYLADLAGQDR
jgi:hypothetical protein